MTTATANLDAISVPATTPTLNPQDQTFHDAHIANGEPDNQFCLICHPTRELFAEPTFLDRAIPLISRFSVIPLAPAEKRPIPGGPGALSRSNNPSTVQQWAEQWPDANVAIVADESIVILESDNIAQLRTIIKNGTGNELPLTLMACGSSPDRPHMFFKRTEKASNVGCLAVPCLFEARFENQYVVAPGSIHPSGAVYRWLNDAEIIPIPDWLVSELARLAMTQKADRRNPKAEVGADGTVAEGGRHYFRFSELGKAWDGEKTEEQMLEIAFELNSNCDPPDAPAKVISEVRDIMRREPNKPGIKVLMGGQEVTVKPAPTVEDWSLMGADDLVCLDIPPRRTVLSENGSTVFYESSVNQILAWRGVGKTMFGLGLANAIASGGTILDFKADRPRRVLYLDGELPLAQLQERVRDMVAVDHRGNVKLFSPEMLKKPRGLNLLSTGDFAGLLKAVETWRPEVVLLDSQSTLMSGDPNKTEFQEGRQEVLRQLRWRGLCIIEMHHLGKSGLQRGLSRNDDILDVQMQLGKVEDHDPADGLMFEVGYPKVRHAANLDTGYVVSLEGGKWTKKLSNDVHQAALLFNEGKTEREVSKALDVSTGQAHKLRTKARKHGLLNERIKIQLSV